MPKHIAKKFDGFGVRPKGLNTCEHCQQWFDPEFAQSTCVCVECDSYVDVCQKCDELTEIIYLDEGECPKCATENPKTNDPHICTASHKQYESKDTSPQNFANNATTSTGYAITAATPQHGSATSMIYVPTAQAKRISKIRRHHYQ